MRLLSSVAFFSNAAGTPSTTVAAGDDVNELLPVGDSSDCSAWPFLSACGDVQVCAASNWDLLSIFGVVGAQLRPFGALRTPPPPPSPLDDDGWCVVVGDVAAAPPKVVCTNCEGFLNIFVKFELLKYDNPLDVMVLLLLLLSFLAEIPGALLTMCGFILASIVVDGTTAVRTDSLHVAGAVVFSVDGVVETLLVVFDLALNMAYGCWCVSGCRQFVFNA